MGESVCICVYMFGVCRLCVCVCTCYLCIFFKYLSSVCYILDILILRGIREKSKYDSVFVFLEFLLVYVFVCARGYIVWVYVLFVCVGFRKGIFIFVFVGFELGFILFGDYF